jgi:hypothetical protein
MRGVCLGVVADVCQCSALERAGPRTFELDGRWGCSCRRLSAGEDGDVSTRQGQKGGIVTPVQGAAQRLSCHTYQTNLAAA